MAVDGLIDLRAATLSALPAAVDAPRYDRAALTAGVVHVGVGNFHRAHQAVYLDALLRRGGNEHWAVCGVGVRPGRMAVRDALAAQDHLYTVLAKHPDGRVEGRVVGSVVQHLLVPDDPGAVVERIAAPATRIVTLTITEGGYGSSGAEDVEADLIAAVPNGTVFGVVLQAMALRRERGLGGLTVVSCDNLQENGAVARAAFLGFARRRDADLAAWMADEVTFPSSMVDRVVPTTGEADREHLAREHGYRDRWPVPCEPLSAWVLEDDFVAGRPPLEDVGVDIVADVRPYEAMKLRLANGTHQALAYAGVLLGHTHVHEALADPDIARLAERYAVEEVVPTLVPIAGVDQHAFAATVRERFGNPQLHDPLVRITAESSDRVPAFVLPVVADQLARGGPVRVAATVVALWASWVECLDADGRADEVQDPRREVLVAAARAQRSRPTAFLEDRALFGDLVGSGAFVDAYVEALQRIQRLGVRAALREA